MNENEIRVTTKFYTIKEDDAFIMYDPIAENISKLNKDQLEYCREFLEVCLFEMINSHVDKLFDIDIDMNLILDKDFEPILKKSKANKDPYFENFLKNTTTAFMQSLETFAKNEIIEKEIDIIFDGEGIWFDDINDLLFIYPIIKMYLADLNENELLYSGSFYSFKLEADENGFVKPNKDGSVIMFVPLFFKNTYDNLIKDNTMNPKELAYVVSSGIYQLLNNI